MTRRLTNAEKCIRYREKMAAARKRASISAGMAPHKSGKVPTSVLLPSHLRPTPVHVTATGLPYIVDRKGISLPFVRGYADG